MCRIDFSSLVRFQFDFENNRSSVRFWKPWFGFLCRSVVKYQKTCKLSFFVCAFCILFVSFLNAQLVLKCMFNLNLNLNHIVFVYKNVKALWEWLKYWLFVWNKLVRFWEKPRKPKFWVWPFDFGSVRVFKNQNRTKIRFPHIPTYSPNTAADSSSIQV